LFSNRLSKITRRAVGAAMLAGVIGGSALGVAGAANADEYDHIYSPGATCYDPDYGYYTC
jgi:hypothetical protein